VGSGKQRRILAIVATDSTYELHHRGDQPVWVGKCIFCNRPLSVAADGTPISRVTIEHIWPRNHGGDDSLPNLALACGGCNREKGGRHDVRHRRDARLLEIVEGLRQRRTRRWREPPELLSHHVAWAQRTAPVAGDGEDE
jgi:hypothetical protein